MDHQPFYIETKFDGERIQLHKQDNRYMYFSRRYRQLLLLLLLFVVIIVYYSSKDYTSSFGGSDKEGSFTPNIHSAFNRLVELTIVVTQACSTCTCMLILLLAESEGVGYTIHLTSPL